MSSLGIFSRTWVDNIFDPAGAQDVSCLAKTGYWITCIVLGLLTAFIPHLIYFCCCRSPAPRDVDSTLDSKDSNKSNISSVLSPPPPPGKYTNILASPPPRPPYFGKSQNRPSNTLCLPPPAPPPPAFVKTATQAVMKLRDTQIEQIPFSPPSLSALARCQLLLHPEVVLPGTCVPCYSFAADIRYLSQFNSRFQLSQLRQAIRFFPSPDERGEWTELLWTQWAQPLDVSGCSHLRLPPNLLENKLFSALNFAGCSWESKEQIAEFASQKFLKSLTLGLEHLFPLDAFHRFMAGRCPLSTLQIGIEDNQKSLFTKTTQLEVLSIRVSRLTPSLLINILQHNPKLRKLTLWYSTTDNIDLAEIQRSTFPKKLRNVLFVQDLSYTDLTQSYQENVQGIKVTVTYTHVCTQSLGNYIGGKPYNFCPYSTYALIERYIAEPEKLAILTRTIAQQVHKSSDLVLYGRNLALHMKPHHWFALEKFLKALENSSEMAMFYNQSLELILRSALAFYQSALDFYQAEQKRRAAEKTLLQVAALGSGNDNRKKTPYPSDDDPSDDEKWGGIPDSFLQKYISDAEKGGAILGSILQKHKDNFEISSALLNALSNEN
jgi:hypothetical protein